MTVTGNFGIQRQCFGKQVRTTSEWCPVCLPAVLGEARRRSSRLVEAPQGMEGGKGGGMGGERRTDGGRIGNEEGGRRKEQKEGDGGSARDMDKE